MMCQACERGEHWSCGLQTWCECECDPQAALDWPGDLMEQADSILDDYREHYEVKP